MGAEVFGVSKDSVKSHQGFAAKLGLPFGLLVDNDWEYRLKLGTPAPTGKEMKRITFVIDGKGVIRHIYYYEGRGNVADHVSEAYDAVKQIVG
ncbi:MAG: redoxin domain-containing protein [Planctomycetales bacterium]|nr:redoxin domain-containing protein [bacterium]UNM10020.1 MAG: redoxin domain-containing protein [Planctomycetales bacterium]